MRARYAILPALVAATVLSAEPPLPNELAATERSSRTESIALTLRDIRCGQDALRLLIQYQDDRERELRGMLQVDTALQPTRVDILRRDLAKAERDATWNAEMERVVKECRP